MVYKWDSFLKPLADGDTVIQILDNNGLVKYSIDPFSVINTFINNNIVKVNIKGDVILLNFSTEYEAKMALPILQEQKDLLKESVGAVQSMPVKPLRCRRHKMWPRFFLG